MILNTFLKTLNLKLTPKAKMQLGMFIVSRYKALNPDAELKKVRIKENGESFEVVDYPKDFLENEKTKKIVSRFLKRGKEIREKIMAERQNK
jgi:hypothetical protein